MQPARSSQDRVAFSAAALDAFRRLSHDENPLHVDAAYARRTPFGTPVVYGMLGVLAALRAITHLGPMRLQTLRCSFPGPLFPEVPYDVSADFTANGRATLRLSRGGSPKVEVIVEFEPSAPHAVLPAMPAEWAPLAAPLAPRGGELSSQYHEGCYAVDPAAAATLDGLLGLALAHLPADQLQALAWVSYCCGMLVPGRQSLIGKVELRFATVVPTAHPLSFAVRTERYDERYGGVDLTATLHAGGQSIAEVTVQAFSRPDPVAFSTDALLEHVPRTGTLAGRSVLVTGGSRGLGAYIAGALGLQGAVVWLNYRSGTADAEAVCAALASLGVTIRLVRGDVTDPVACSRMCAEATPDGKLDILVNNASPAILAQSFGELGATGLAQYVMNSLQGYTAPMHAVLPALRRSCGWVVTVSSSYVASAPARFSHYVAAKAAIEGMVASLSKEEKVVRFLLVRPPKILTDQTNTNFDFEARLHPARVAARIVEALQQPLGEARILQVDTF